MARLRLTWRPASVWLLLLVLLALHHDFWQWDQIEPLLWGWAPVALWYHAGHTLIYVLAFYLLGRWAWPDPPETEPASEVVSEPRNSFPPAPSEPAPSERSPQP